MIYRFSIALIPEGKWYVAHCLELGVVSQGKTIKEAQKNIQEAIELYLEDQPKSEIRRLQKSRSPLLTSLDVHYG